MTPSPLRRPRNRRRFASGLLASAMAMLVAGCQSLALGVANIGQERPDQSVVFDPARNLALDIYRPETVVAAGGAPVVVFFYGGGWRTGNRAQYRFVGRRLAEQGMLAVVADYRLSPRATFPEFVEDGARAVAWARRNAEQHGGDPQRLFVAGHSAGAQIAALLGADARYLAEESLAPRDLAGVIGLAGAYNFSISGGYEEVFGPQAQWPRAQAVNFVDGDEPPFLLVHGTDDKVVLARGSQMMADRLRANSGSATLVLLPGGGHSTPLMGLFRPQGNPEVLEAIRRFVAAPGSYR